MCYVGKRTAMHHGRSVLGCLHQVGLYGIAQEHADGTSHAKVLHGEGLALDGGTQKDILYASAQVSLVLCKAEDGHNLGSRSDVETALAGYAVGLGTKTRNDVAQVAVVHVQHALPQHLAHGKALGLMLVDVVVQQGGNHVVCRGDGVEVASKVQVNLVHRQNLCIAAAGSTAFHAKAGTQRGFAQSHHGLLANAVHTQSQTHADGGLAYASLGGSDGRNQYQAALLYLLLVDEREGQFGYVSAIRFHHLIADTESLSNLCDWFQRGLACNFNVAFHVLI